MINYSLLFTDEEKLILTFYQEKCKRKNCVKQLLNFDRTANKNIFNEKHF